MNSSEEVNYQRVAEAIAYIRENFKAQPSLKDVAGIVHLSPEHFQRVFRDWAGVSPKKFLQYTSLEYAKSLLEQNPKMRLAELAEETGLSATSRLHDLFVSIEGMTPAEYKNGAEQLEIRYRFATGVFGRLLVASTAKGVCHLVYTDEETEALNALQQKFPAARFSEGQDEWQDRALTVFQGDRDDLPEIRLHLRGTEFQLKVWECLLKIPSGALSTYSEIATQLGQPNASRAVGTAVGSNPVAYLIPCHRVIRASGEFGNYRWGADRKTAMIAWEAVHENREPGLTENQHGD